MKDHTKSLRDAEKAAHRFGVTVPKTRSPSEECELRTVGAFSGAAFDRSCADLEVRDNIQDMQETFPAGRSAAPARRRGGPLPRSGPTRTGFSPG